MLRSRRCIAALALVGAVMFAGTAFAADSLKGTIAKTGKSHIVLKVLKVEHMIEVNDKTKFTLNGKQAKLSDLMIGFNATVSVKKDGRKMLAQSVSASSKKPGTLLIADVAKPKTRWVGTIQKVGKNNFELRLLGKKMTYTVECGKDKKVDIKVDGKPAKFADLKIGFSTAVTGSKKGDKLVATAVTARSKQR